MRATDDANADEPSKTARSFSIGGWWRVVAVVAVG
jgi:hypothetical protein